MDFQQLLLCNKVKLTLKFCTKDIHYSTVHSSFCNEEPLLLNFMRH